MGVKRVVLHLLLASVAFTSSARAQIIGDRLDAKNCAAVIGGNVEKSTINVICGMPHEQVAELVRLAASPSAGDRAALLVRLNAIVPANSRFSVEAVARFLEILREQPVEDAKLADRFAQIGQEHVRLLQEIRAFRVADPDVQALRDAAAAALQGAPNHDVARARLEEARRLVRAKREAVAKVLTDQIREEASLLREQAKIEAARLRFAETARFYEEAARLLPAEDRDARSADWVLAGDSWTEQGLYFGDNRALINAIAGYRAALEERTRARVPLDWAATQNSVGNALQILGEREGGTARLEEAVAAYRAALQEYTRDWLPLQWSMTQNNLGDALRTLGQRESGTARLTEAVVAFRAVLEELPREWVPLHWAWTQNNLGNALQTIGERESGTTRLEEAIVAYRAALEELTRDRIPLAWATSQNNLGVALSALGQRESGTARLDEAVAAFQAALEELTRARAPFNWATTQNNLGVALRALGQRESGAARLEEAVAAFRAALEEFTRDRGALQWARTQNNLGITLWILAQREGGTARLEEAVAAWDRCLTVSEAAWSPEFVQEVRSRRDKVLAEIAHRKSR